MTKIEIKKPTKVFSKKIGVSFTKFFEVLGKSAVMLSDDKPMSALKEFMGLISGLKVSEKDVESIAYLLVYKSIINTGYSLFLELNDIDFKEERNTLIIGEERKQFYINVEQAIEEQEVVLTNDFFEYPDKLNLLHQVYKKFGEWLKLINVEKEKRLETLSKFYPRFIVELNKEWNNNPTLYKNLIDKLNSPFTNRLEVIDEWNRRYGNYSYEIRRLSKTKSWNNH